MTYDQAVAYLFSSLGDIRGANFGLSRIEALVERLGRPERSFKVVHIAGTNGKGSTGAMIEAGLRAAGHRTGFYSSPHLSSINERYRIDGQPIDDAGFVKAVERVREACEALAVEDLHPTFFESVTACSFCAFEHAKAEYGVIEVGLGGRLDATNVVRPEVAVITRVDLDHEAWLGSRPEVIAGEKAGILKPGCRAVFAKQDPRVQTVLEKRARAIGIAVAHKRIAQDVSADGAGKHSFDVDGMTIRLNLAGRHQVENALTAITALEELDVPAPAIERGLAAVEWPGRLETLPGKPEVLLDAAHNPSGARQLAAFLEHFHSGRRIRLVFGAARDKAVDEMAGWLFPAVDRVTLTQSQVTRSVSPETLRGIVDHHHARIDCAPTLQAALEGDDDLVVVAGSIFLVGEARELLTCSGRDCNLRTGGPGTAPPPAPHASN